MRVLVTGGTGQVGRALARRADRVPFLLDIRGRDTLDITDARALRAAVQGCGAVINCAAYTAVDAAEIDRAPAFAINAEAPGLLAGICADAGAALVHLSTDYVFDGTKETPWSEDDPVNPLNVYGASKAAGEAAVRSRLRRHLIVRTSWVYDGTGRNFLTTMLRLADRHAVLRIVDDQVGAPTPATDVAGAVLVALQRALATEGPWGTFHYTAAGAASWAEFAEAIFAGRVRRPAVDRVTTEAYNAPAPRPRNSVLDCSRIERTFGPPRRHWRDALAAILATIPETMR